MILMKNQSCYYAYLNTTMEYSSTSAEINHIDRLLARLNSCMKNVYF